MGMDAVFGYPLQRIEAGLAPMQTAYKVIADEVSVALRVLVDIRCPNADDRGRMLRIKRSY
jgi:hypothetical protein